MRWLDHGLLPAGRADADADPTTDAVANSAIDADADPTTDADANSATDYATCARTTIADAIAADADTVASDARSSNANAAAHVFVRSRVWPLLHRREGHAGCG